MTKDDFKELKKLEIPVFLATGRRMCGKTKKCQEIFNFYRKKDERCLYISANNYSLAAIKQFIKQNKVEFLIIDETENIL